jgi:acetylglutamate kinase
MTGISAQADAVVRAVSVARSLAGRPVVVKLGGSAMEEPAATRGTLECVATLQTLGVRLLLVHGGGKPIDRAMATAGLSPVKLSGRRYTDDATLAVVVRVLAELNADVVRQLNTLGGRAVGFTDVSGFPLTGDRLHLTDDRGKYVALGHVGTVSAVDVPRLSERGVVPVLPSLARSTDGGWLYVNADTVAAAVAGAVGAESVLFLTDTPGILRNRLEPDSLVPRLSVSECRQLIADGVIAGGMIPKVEACFDALTAGARRAVILDGRNPRALLTDFVSDTVSGTTVVP